MSKTSYKTTVAIGNGESRRGIDIDSLQGLKIGCNAIHRDFVVDYLIAVDRRCVTEALESPNCLQTKILTRKDWVANFRDPRVNLVPDLPFTGAARADNPFHWGSGPYAVLQAAVMSKNISLIGFDLWSKDQYVNNVYKGTPNYNDSNYRAVDPSYWVYQISKIFQHYTDKYFIVYNVNSWKMPDTWKLDNVDFKTLDNIRDY